MVLDFFTVFDSLFGMAYRCSICKSQFKNERAHWSYVYKDAKLAEAHGYGMIRPVPDAYFPSSRQAIPAKHLLCGDTWHHPCYARDYAIKLYNRLLHHWNSKVFLKTYELLYPRLILANEIQADIRAWFTLLLTDKEAFAIYELMAESLGPDENHDHLEELVERLADLFDLPKYWENEKFWTKRIGAR